MAKPAISPHARVICGRGSDGNRGDLHRAIDVARQLHAAGKWDGQADITIHAPHDLHRRVQHSGRAAACNGVRVYPAIHALVEGRDYTLGSQPDIDPDPTEPVPRIPPAPGGPP